MVEKLLMDLKASKSQGLDGIHPRVLKELDGSLVSFLNIGVIFEIFQHCASSCFNS